MRGVTKSSSKFRVWTGRRSRQKIERLMSDALAGWQERYPDVTVRKLLVCEQPARALVETSQSAQLVVLGSHGRNALTRRFLGSVSNAVVQSVRMPVIVARPS